MSKGSEFERYIAKELSFWWTQEEDDPREDIFYRTHGSGSRHTARIKKNKNTINAAGDLMFIDEIGKPFIDMFIIELKSGYTTTGRIKTKDIENIIKKAKTNDKSIEKTLRNYVSGKLKRSGDTIDLLDYIDSDRITILMKWWNKLEKERIECGRKFSILIFKRDLKKICMMVNYDLWNAIVDSFYTHFKNVKSISLENEKLVIFNYEEFINNVHPSFVINMETI